MNCLKMCCLVQLKWEVQAEVIGSILDNISRTVGKPQQSIILGMYKSSPPQ